MPTRSTALGRYAGLAPELQDTLRRNGMQARLVQSGDGVLLAVQGHDSPLLTYPLTRERLMALTDGGTNSSNRKAYDAFAAIVKGDFDLPKNYVHARNANGRVTMGLHGYRIGEGEYGRVASPYRDLWARRSMLGWTPRNQEGFHLRRAGGELRYGGAPLVPDRPDGRMKPGELQNGGYGFYYKGNQAQQTQASSRSAEDVLTELRTVVPEIQPRPATDEKAKPYSELITSDVYFSKDKWNEVLSSHGIVVEEKAGTLTVKSTSINRDLVYDLREDEMAVLSAESLKDIPVAARLDVINGVIGKDWQGKITMEMLESKEPISPSLSPAALDEIREQERSLHPQPVIAEDMSYLVMQQAVLEEQEDERRGIGRVWGESLYDMHEGWFREGAHGREVSVGEIKVEPVRDDSQEARQDMKYRMTAVINGEEISHEITRRQYDKFMAVDDYHRMKLFSKVFDEVDMKQLPREQREGGAHIGAAILAALTVAGEMARGPRMAPDLYMERHTGGHVYMKPGVDSPQDIASRAFEAGLNAAEHGVGLGR